MPPYKVLLPLKFHRYFVINRYFNYKNGEFSRLIRYRRYNFNFVCHCSLFAEKLVRIFILFLFFALFRILMDLKNFIKVLSRFFGINIVRI